jgi:hypothetical protein
MTRLQTRVRCVRSVGRALSLYFIGPALCAGDSRELDPFHVDVRVR